jgi:hypothetical protein
MELKFTKDLELKIGDGCIYTIPNYVTRLSEDEIQNAKRSERRSALIVAAGTDPKDQKVSIVTADGRVLIFDAPAFHIPNGTSMPTHGGAKLFFPNDGKRWPLDTPGYFAEASWVIKRSTSALEGATLVTNYKNEDNHQTT